MNDTKPYVLPTGTEPNYTQPANKNSFTYLFRYNWYRVPFRRITFVRTNGKETNLYLILPPSAKTKRNPNQAWFWRIAYYKIELPANPANGGNGAAELVSFPAASNWHARDYVAEAGSKAWQLYGKKGQRLHPHLHWMLPKFRYLFLAAEHDEKKRSFQETPAVLELPGSYRDYKKDARQSAGRTLQQLPSITDPLHPDGKPKYGCICDPDNLLTIEIGCQGNSVQTQYAVIPHDHRQKIEPNHPVLQNLEPFEDILNRPADQYVARMLKYMLSAEEIETLCPDVLNIKDEAPEPVATTPAPRLDTVKLNTMTLVTLMNTLNDQERLLVEEAHTNATRLCQALKTGDPRRLEQWKPYMLWN